MIRRKNEERIGGAGRESLELGKETEAVFLKLFWSTEID
jgi:hypothetical protein